MKCYQNSEDFGSAGLSLFDVERCRGFFVRELTDVDSRDTAPAGQLGHCVHVVAAGQMSATKEKIEAIEYTPAIDNARLAASHDCIPTLLSFGPVDGPALAAGIRASGRELVEGFPAGVVIEVGVGIVSGIIRERFIVGRGGVVPDYLQLLVVRRDDRCWRDPARNPRTENNDGTCREK
jgi:hypothetical protein